MTAIPLNTDSSPEAVIELLYKLKVKDVMTHKVIVASPQDTMRFIQHLMKKNCITGVPIAHEGSLCGIISMDDIVNAFDGGWVDEKAEAHMTTNIIVLQESMPVSFCVSYFNKYKFGRFPVLNKENQLIGIVTASDVISALLVAMNKEVERLEQGIQAVQAQVQGHAEQSGQEGEISSNVQKTNTPRIVEFKTEPFNFEIAGVASTALKKILKGMNIDTALIRRIGIASYELEINQVVHSTGGVMKYCISDNSLTIEAHDTGPGIPDLTKALQEGFSTASDRVRALGFGAGMGLPNTKRVSDGFSIDSTVGKGTFVTVTFSLTVLKNTKEE